MRTLQKNILRAWAEGRGEGQSGNPDKGLNVGLWVILRKAQQRAGMCPQGVSLSLSLSLPTLCLQDSSWKHPANPGRAEIWSLFFMPPFPFFCSSPLLGSQHSQLLALDANLGMAAVILELEVLGTVVHSQNSSCSGHATNGTQTNHQGSCQSSERNSKVLPFGVF